MMIDLHTFTIRDCFFLLFHKMLKEIPLSVYPLQRTGEWEKFLSSNYFVDSNSHQFLPLDAFTRVILLANKILQ